MKDILADVDPERRQGLRSVVRAAFHGLLLLLFRGISLCRLTRR
jgi:hypothetical protein